MMTILAFLLGLGATYTFDKVMKMTIIKKDELKKLKNQQDYLFSLVAAMWAKKVEMEKFQGSTPEDRAMLDNVHNFLSSYQKIPTE